MPNFYRTKTIQAGNQIEYYEHEHPVAYGFAVKGKGGRKSGSLGGKERSKEYRKRTTNKAKNELIRLINANFTEIRKGTNFDYYKFITLTFREGAIPDITDVKRANIELKKFFRKLREICKTTGRELKYVCVIEFQDQNKRGAVHYHFICDIPVIPVTKEKAEQWVQDRKLPPDYNSKLNLYDLWGHGAVTIKAIMSSNRERETGTMIETPNIGQYVAAYMVKDICDMRLMGMKSYLTSQGLKRPKVLYNEAAEKIIEGLGKENVVYASCYPDKHHNSPVHYTKFNLLKKS